MISKPAATKGRTRNKRKGRSPLPDPSPRRTTPLPPPPEARRCRSLRSRLRRKLSEDDDYELEHEEHEEEERGLKKLRLAVKLPRSPAGRQSRSAAEVPSVSSSSSSPSSASSSSSSFVDDENQEKGGDEEEETVKSQKNRLIGRGAVAAAVTTGRSGHLVEGKEIVVRRSLGDRSVSCSAGNLLALRSETPMPERNQLELVLDKLQKKDTYGAFAEPVDPEELPDYHDVIEHPMDFGSVRKKLARSAYHSFEQYEDDVFLICSNAMQYNAPDTIYFRQACSIQDMATKKFQRIRDNIKSTEIDQRSEEKARLCYVEKKTQTQCTPPTQCKGIQEPLVSNVYYATNLASAGDTCSRLSTVSGIEKSIVVNGLLDGSSSPGESKGESKQERDDFSVKCSPSKLGCKPALVDENRRATYNIAPDQKPLFESNLVLNIFEDEQKLLVPVGLDAEHSYARSLARFATSLGPVAWEIVSKKIEKALPPGMKFGLGWVGEYEMLPSPFLSLKNNHQQLASSSTSQSRTTTKDKVSEIKAKVGQKPTSSNVKLSLKNKLTTSVPGKASKTGESTSCVNTKEQKPKILGVAGPTHSKITGSGVPKQIKDSNNMNCGLNNQMNNGNSYGTTIRVKEESPSEETRERRQEVFCGDEKTRRSSGMASNQKKNLATIDFTNACTNNLQQVPMGNPSSKLTNHRIPGVTLRDSSHMQAGMRKELQTVSSRSGNNVLEMAIGGSNNGNRLKNPLASISSNQTGLSHDQALSDPVKLVGFAGNFNNQQCISSSGTSHVEKSMPIIPPLSRENHSPATSAAARAWMSVGNSVQWKSVDTRNTIEKPVKSSPLCSPTWKPLTSTSRINGDSMVRPANLPIQVFSDALQVKNRGLVIFPQLISPDLSKYENHPHWQGLSPQSKSKQRDNLPPDLNIGYQPPASPVQPSSVAMESQQPDLALQL